MYSKTYDGRTCFVYIDKRLLLFYSYREDSTMPINKNELTKEMVEKALNVKDAKELMALAKSEGIELTKEEAEAYMAELEDYELDEDTLKNVAGGLQGMQCQTLKY